MTPEERLDVLLRCLLEEYEEVRVPDSLPEKRQLLRSLMNVRPPAPASKDFLKVQDAYLGELLAQRGVTKLEDLTPVRPGLYLWPISVAGRHHYPGSGRHCQRGQQPDAGLLCTLPRMH